MLRSCGRIDSNWKIKSINNFQIKSMNSNSSSKKPTNNANIRKIISYSTSKTSTNTPWTPSKQNKIIEKSMRKCFSPSSNNSLIVYPKHELSLSFFLLLIYWLLLLRWFLLL